jgi:RNA polymerase sigma factor (sigma-70 family)
MAGNIFSWQTLASAACVDEQAPGAILAGKEQQPSHAKELETLYVIRRPEMIRFLVRIGVDAVEAEDITQEVFLNAFDGPSNQKRPDNLFHWTLACARNLAISRYQRGKREVLAPAERWKCWEKTLAGDNSTEPDVCIYRKECELRLARAVAQLSPVEQQCLVLRSRGVTFREIGRALNVPMQTAVYTTDTAIKKLQRKLQPPKR